MTDRQDMEAVLEAILFVAHDPVSRARLVEVFGERERAEAEEALDAVVERYRDKEGRGVMIDEVAGGLRLVTRPDLHGYLRRFFEVQSSSKLSMPALETLAIIAYRQPITGPEIAELRNVASTGVVKTLLERRLIRIAGRKEVVGKPFLYATTREFLMHFGLRSLKELPPLEQFEELFGEEIEAAPEILEPDAEEIADREAAEIADADDEAAERREAEAIEDERAAAAEAGEKPAAEEEEPAAEEEEPAAEEEEPAEEEPAAEDEGPAADEEPVAKDDEEPVAKDDEEPVAKDDEEPVAKGDEEPAAMETEEPAAKDGEEPSPEEDEPASGEPAVAEVKT